MTRLALLLFAVVAFPGADDVTAQAPILTPANRAFVPILLRADGTLKSFAIVARRQISDELDLVLVLGTPSNHAGYNGSYTWLQEDRLGIFLQDKHNAGRVFTLAIEPGPPCQIRLERVTSRDVLISCPGAYDFGKGTGNQKFVFEANEKRMVQRYAYSPFANYLLVQSADGLYFVTSDLHNVLAAAWDASANSFRLLPEAEASRIIEGISIQIYSGPDYEYRVPVLPPKQRVTFGPGRRFELPSGGGDDPAVIVENRREGVQEFPLPQSSRREWSVKRPEERKAILPASAALIREQIGPYQVEGDRLWFGKTFYNGEGMTGVGGFGYFDAALRSYRLYAPPEMWKSSVSALFSEPAALWLGLARAGEGWGMSGGLLRWDRATKSVLRFDLKADLHQIVRWGDALYLATDQGIEVLRGNKVDRYIVDAARNGRFQVAACDGGYR